MSALQTVLEDLWEGRIPAFAEPKPLRLSVVIPVYNEEKRIARTLKECLAYLERENLIPEILVVDDGSTDETLEVARLFRAEAENQGCGLRLLRLPRNQGKGEAVRQGALAAEGEIILYMDADNATPLSEFDRFRGFLRSGSDVVVGSRALDRSLIQRRQPFYREWIGKTGNFLIQRLAVRGIQDTQCGFKAFTRKAARLLFSRQRIHRFGFDIELLSIARGNGMRIAEVPVPWRHDPASRVSAVKDTLRTFGELVTIFWNERKGLYGRPMGRTLVTAEEVGDNE